MSQTHHYKRGKSTLTTQTHSNHRWVAITGASSGIGYAAALAFADRGYSVALIARRRARLAELAAEIEARSAPQTQAQARVIVADLSLDAGIDEALAQLTDLKLEVLIHNAGMIGPIAPLAEVSRDQWRRHLTLNLEAPLFLTQGLIDQLQGGRVIHISSGAAHKSIAGWGAYCVSKGALYRLWECFKDELLERDIALASVRPGVVDTEMQAEIRGAEHPAFVKRSYFESLKEEGELISPEAVAEYLIHLCLNTSTAELIAREWDIRD